MAQVAEAKSQSTRRAGAKPQACPMPLGRCVPAGRLRWHVLRVPEGREQAACERIARLLPDGLADDVFVPRRERFVKRSGSWSLQAAPMWRGYAIAAARDAEALAKALGRAGAQAGLVGLTAEGWAPLAPEFQEWLAAVMDGAHVARASVGRIDEAGLRVDFGPLVGCERSIAKVDRHRRQCWVRVCGLDVPLPLEVPVKRDAASGQQAGAACVGARCD